MPDDLATKYEARRSLLEHVAHSLEGEIRECLAHCESVDHIEGHVANVSSFLAKAKRAVGSGVCSDPLVEIEDQIAGRVEVCNIGDIAEVEARLRDCFSTVESSTQVMDTNNNRFTVRRMVCVISPQCKPPGWNTRDDVPNTFVLQLRAIVADGALDPGETSRITPETLSDRKERSPSPAASKSVPPQHLERGSRSPGEHKPEFDVFLAHNTTDKLAVTSLASVLANRGIRPWLDSQQIPPGQFFQESIQMGIKRANALAICIGTEGLGRWEALELKAAISKSINEGIPVIPVLLPGVTAIPESFPFLAEFNWVQFETSINEPLKVDLLIWGITGQRPESSDESSTTPVVAAPPSSTTTPKEQPIDAGKPGRSGRVLFGLHGIRTHADWNRALYEVAADDAWQVRTDRWNFGYFSIFRFLMPRARSAKVQWFRQAYRDEIHDRQVLLDQDEYPSIVAHSFGTYILGNALLKYDWLTFNKIVLCGSILPVDFPWDVLIQRGQVQAVRNEFGVQDIWSGLVRWFVAGTGPSGRRGFECQHERLEQEGFEYTHSEYFDKGHMEAKWLPFFDERVPRIPPTRTTLQRLSLPKPWGLYVIYIVLLCTLILGYFPIHRWLMQPAVLQQPKAAADQKVTAPIDSRSLPTLEQRARPALDQLSQAKKLADDLSFDLTIERNKLLDRLQKYGNAEAPPPSDWGEIISKVNSASEKLAKVISAVKTLDPQVIGFEKQDYDNMTTALTTKAHVLDMLSGFHVPPTADEKAQLPGFVTTLKTIVTSLQAAGRYITSYISHITGSEPSGT